jgi:tRNA U55 pseudouridine synthase TruB
VDRRRREQVAGHTGALDPDSYGLL